MTVPSRLECESEIESIEGGDMGNVEETKRWWLLSERKGRRLCRRSDLFDYDQGASRVKTVEQRRGSGFGK